MNTGLFLNPKPPEDEPGDWLEWSATVHCQICDELVEDQRLYPSNKVLWWKCSKGHRSIIEGFNIF